MIGCRILKVSVRRVEIVRMVPSLHLPAGNPLLLRNPFKDSLIPATVIAFGTRNLDPGLIGVEWRGEADSKRLLKPDLEAPCGLQPLGGSIAATG